MEKIISDEGLSRTQAFQRLSELTGRRAGTVAANYYRVARQRGATLAAPRPARLQRSGAASVRARVPRPTSSRPSSRAEQAIEELSAIVRRQEKEIADLRADAAKWEQVRDLLEVTARPVVTSDVNERSRPHRMLVTR